MELLTKYVQRMYDQAAYLVQHSDNVSVLHSVVLHVICDVHDECTIFGDAAQLFNTDDDVLGTLVLLQNVLSNTEIQNATGASARDALFLQTLRNYASEVYYANLQAYVLVAQESQKH